MFWQATHNFQLSYIKWVFNPPWALVLLWPISGLPLYSSWGLLVCITVLAAAALIPHRLGFAVRVVWLSLTIFSYPFVRQIIEGNIEVLVLIGFLLLSHGLSRQNPWSLAASLIFFSSKIQMSWLFILALLPFLWYHWPLAKLVRSAGAILIFCIPFLLWRGDEWWSMLRVFPKESPYNLSLMASLLRFGVSSWLASMGWFSLFAATIWLVYRLRLLSPEKYAGILVAVSLLLAPYAGNSTLIAVLILGVVPYAAEKPWPRIFLMLLYYLPLVMVWDFRILDVYAYFSAVVLLTAIVLALNELHGHEVVAQI